MVAQKRLRKGMGSVAGTLAVVGLVGGGVFMLSHRAARSEEGMGPRIEVVVDSAEGLDKALHRAGDGSVIKLAPGDYPQVEIANVNFSGTVTVTSAQADRPARIGAIMVRKTSGLVLRDLVLAPKAGNMRDMPLRFEKNSRLTLDHILAQGPENVEDFGKIPGPSFHFGDHVTISNSRFTRFYHALQLVNIDELKVVGNEFWNIRSDGMRGGGLTHALYADNICTEFHPVVPDHPDCIQLWSTNQSEPGRDIVIRDNLVVRGGGDGTQGVFVRDTSTKLPFENVEISGNLVIGTIFNGIAVDGVNGGKVIGNEAIALGGQKTWIRLQRAHGIELRDNVAPRVLFQDSGDIRDSRNDFNEGGHQAYRARLIKWLEAKPERRRKDSVLLPKLIAAAP